MQTHFHHYSGYAEFVQSGGCLMTLIILPFLALVVFAIASKPLVLIENPLEALSYLLPLLISAGFTAYIANLHPSIGADEDGILVRFL
jgi:hypothetical protein